MSFDLQGHRGSRGLKPENTLPGFEAALDLGVSSIETDVQAAASSLVLYHDTEIGPELCRREDGAAVTRVPLASLALAELRNLRADRNPEPARFPQQDPSVTPLAGRWAAERGLHPYAPPTLAELLEFLAEYVRERSGKTAAQRARAGRLILDLELKHRPFHDADATGRVAQVLELVRAAGFLDRVRVRSFDHRLVRRARQIEPRLVTGVLIAGTAPVDPVALVRQAEASFYLPDYRFLDQQQVRQCHDAGLGVIPWTVNEIADLKKLLDWGVDGITTDYPDRLAPLLHRRGIDF